MALYWDSEKVGTRYELQNDNVRAVCTSASTSQSAIGATSATGKMYFEIHPVLLGATVGFSIGICTSDHGGNDRIGFNDYSWAWMANGRLYHNGSYDSVTETFDDEDILQVAVDLDNNSVWFGKNNTWIDSGDPANGTNPAFDDAGITGDIFPAFSLRNLNDAVDLQVLATEFTYSPPSGFIAWSAAEYGGEFTTTDTLEGDFEQNSAFETTDEFFGVPGVGRLPFFYAGIWNDATSTIDSLKKIYDTPYTGWTLAVSDIHTTYSGIWSKTITEMCSDAEGNVYTGISYNSVRYLDKIDKDGNPVWHITMPESAVLHQSMCSDGDYVYVATNYNSGKIYKFNASDGTQVTGGGWPVTNSIIDGNSFVKLIYGSDGYLYAAVNDSGGNTYNGYVYKIDPSDGSEEWNYQIPQGAGGNDIRDIDVNADGLVALASIEQQSGDDCHVLNSSGTRTSYWDIGAQVSHIAIDDDGYVYACPESNPSGINLGKYDPDDADPAGNPAWTITTIGDATQFAISTAKDALYHYDSVAAAINKIDLSGNVIYTIESIDSNLIALCPHPGAAAWSLDVTTPSNGEIQTDLGVELDGSHLFPSGEDIEIFFVPDEGYVVGDVEIDSVSQGAIDSYTFEDFSGGTAESTFAQGFSCGDDLATTDALGGAATYQVTSDGDIETADSIDGGIHLTAIVNCAPGFATTDSISGDIVTVETLSSIVLFKLILTGAADGESDIEIPIKSFQMRTYSDTASYLEVVIPGIDYADEIAARSNGNLELYMVYADVTAVELLRERVMVVSFNTVTPSKGAINQSITLSGHESTAQRNARIAAAKTIALDDSWINYRQTSAGLTTLRFSRPHLTIRAGDTVVNNGMSIVVGRITWMKSESIHHMEIREAA